MEKSVLQSPQFCVFCDRKYNTFSFFFNFLKFFVLFVNVFKRDNRQQTLNEYVINILNTPYIFKDNSNWFWIFNHFNRWQCYILQNRPLLKYRSFQTLERSKCYFNIVKETKIVVCKKKSPVFTSYIHVSEIKTIPLLVQSE